MLPATTGTFFGQSMTAGNLYVLVAGGGYGTNWLALDSAQNLFFADSFQNTIRMVPFVDGMHYGQNMVAGTAYIVAGNIAFHGTSPDGTLATSALLYNPQSVAVDSAGNIFIADTGNNLVRMVSATSTSHFGIPMLANRIYTIAGDGSQSDSGDGANALSAEFQDVSSVTVDALGNVFVGDYVPACRIRVIAATTSTIFGLSLNQGDIQTVIGNGTCGSTPGNGQLPSAISEAGTSVSFDTSGNLYFPDYSNGTIRVVPNSDTTLFGVSVLQNLIYTIAGIGSGSPSNVASPNGTAALSAQIAGAQQVALDSDGNLYVPNGGFYEVQLIPQANATLFGQPMLANKVYTIAGSAPFVGEDSPVADAHLSGPSGVAFDASGNMSIVDGGNNVIRYVPVTSGTFFGISMTGGNIYAIAGFESGSWAAYSEGAVALGHAITSVYQSVFDSHGNVLFIDTPSVPVLRLLANQTGNFYGAARVAGHVYTLAGDGATATLSGIGGLATGALMSGLSWVTTDANDNIYLSDIADYEILFIPNADGSHFGQMMTAHHIYTIVGDGVQNRSAEGTAISSAELLGPYPLVVDSSGNLFLGDVDKKNEARVMMIPASDQSAFGQTMLANHLYTVAGSTGYGYAGDGAIGTDALLTLPSGLAIDANGNLMITEIRNRVQVVAAQTNTYYSQSMSLGFIYTLAGDGSVGFSGDGGLGTSAVIDSPNGGAIDPLTGNFVFTDSGNNLIREISQ